MKLRLLQTGWDFRITCKIPLENSTSNKVEEVERLLLQSIDFKQISPMSRDSFRDSGPCINGFVSKDSRVIVTVNESTVEANLEPVIIFRGEYFPAERFDEETNRHWAEQVITAIADKIGANMSQPTVQISFMNKRWILERSGSV